MTRIAGLTLVGMLLASCATQPEQGVQPRDWQSKMQTQQAQPEGGPQPTPAGPPCTGEGRTDVGGYTLRDPGLKVEMLWTSGFVPWWVRQAPDGRILAVSDGGDSIYEIRPDGTLGVAFACPGAQIETFAAASDGALWFASRDGGRLYRIDADGTIQILAQNGNRNLEAGPDGSVYAMEQGLVRITSDGTQQRITDEVSGRKFGVGPNGEIVAQVDGRILRVHEDGRIETLADGYSPETWVTFGPDKRVYLTDWSKVDALDLKTGEISPVPSLTGSNIGEAGTFAQDGRLLLYHPLVNVTAVDLESGAREVYYQAQSASWASAVSPDGTTYIAYGNRAPNGETIIYRVKDRQTLEEVARVDGGQEREMAFDAQGNGYLSVGDASLGAALLRFSPTDGSVERHAATSCRPQALAVHPQTDALWWDDCNVLHSFDGGADVANPMPSDGENTSLAITPSGDLYLVSFEHRDDPTAPYQRGLYRWDAEASEWILVQDITPSDPNMVLAEVVACPDGRVYTVESQDAETLQWDSFAHAAIRRLEADDSLTVLGFGFSYDALSATCDAQGRIVFSTGAGIWAVTPP